MLIIVDAQNCDLHPEGSSYMETDPAFIFRIVEKVQQALAQDQTIIFTRDIPIEHKELDERKWDLQIIDDLKELLDEAIEVEKHYYGIPPGKMVTLAKELSAVDFTKEKIEIIGIETEICVLANLMIFLSTFPEAEFVVSKSMVASKNTQGEEYALELFKHWGVTVLE